MGARARTTGVDRAGACVAQCAVLAGARLGVAAVVSADEWGEFSTVGGGDVFARGVYERATFVGGWAEPAARGAGDALGGRRPADPGRGGVGFGGIGQGNEFARGGGGGGFRLARAADVVAAGADGGRGGAAAVRVDGLCAVEIWSGGRSGAGQLYAPARRSRRKMGRRLGPTRVAGRLAAEVGDGRGDGGLDDTVAVFRATLAAGGRVVADRRGVCGNDGVPLDARVGGVSRRVDPRAAADDAGV